MTEVLINSRARHPTWKCHWFPTAPIRSGTQLYANGGALQKYDLAFPGSNSQGYEYRYNSTSTRSRYASWTGHCDSASRVVSLLPEPKRNVVYNGVEFTPLDIQGLLIKIINALPFTLRDWVGLRFPEGRITDPSPQHLINKLRQWSLLYQPVIFDIEPNYPVWNYPYDYVAVDWNRGCLMIRSTGFPNESRDIYFNWMRNMWLSKNIDFGWVVSANADLLDPRSWPTENKRTTGSAFFNPRVSPRRVFEIYIKSI